jgi:histidine triad (HIT) family protein
MAALNDSEACVFCDIIASRAEASVVHEDDHVIAFMDVEPVTDGHVLIVPRVHAAALEDLDEDLALGCSEPGTGWHARCAGAGCPAKG